MANATGAVVLKASVAAASLAQRDDETGDAVYNSEVPLRLANGGG